MTNDELRRLAEKLVAMKRFSDQMGVVTGKSQGALIKHLSPDETASLAQITMEMMKNDETDW